MAQRARPLSPFLHYRWQYTNTLSILHRITGVLLSLGFFLLVYWLAAAAAGPERYAGGSGMLGSPLVQLVLFGAGVQLLLPPAERCPAPVLRSRATASSSRPRARAAGPWPSARWCSGSRSLVRGAGRARGCGMSLRSPLRRVTGPRLREGRRGPLVRPARHGRGARPARPLVRRRARLAGRRVARHASWAGSLRRLPPRWRYCWS